MALPPRTRIREYLQALDLNQLLQAAGDEHVTRLIEIAYVASVQPALPHRLCGLVRPIQVAHHYL